MLRRTELRKYEQTHPWLTFNADLKRAPWRLWAILGECQSKCEHIAGVPLRPVTARALHRLYLARGVLATTAIEGNTLTEEEVVRHLAGGLELPRSRKYLSKEIDNIVNACNEVGERMVKGGASHLSVDGIAELNRMVLDGLDVAEHVAPGRMRTDSVTVGRYRAAPAEDCPYLMQRLCDWTATFEAPAGFEIMFAILKAVLMHLYIAWIHPFGDGNGRTARLVEFQILVASGVPSCAAHLLSNHYNLTRTDYARQLDLASRSGGDILPFIEYAAAGFRDGLKEQLDRIRAQQWDVTWRNYVHEAFRDKQRPGDIRRRHLILDMSRRDKPLPLAELPTVSPRVAAAYAHKTPKTLARDVRALVGMGLLIEDRASYRANKEVILAFLAPRALGDSTPPQSADAPQD